jgi:ABC-type Mn2+/Zn2+ transport system ATPase subunit
LHDPDLSGAGSPPIAEVARLAVGYGGPAVLDGVTFSLEGGQTIGVLGPNGAGKSTLFRALLGELAPLRGSVRVSVRCGVVPQTERTRLDYPVSALDVALMGTLGRIAWWRRPGRVERRRAHAALDEVGLDVLAARQFGELSGGQRQRVLIARALVQDAGLLLLDEPFSGVDEPTADRLMSLLDRLASEGRTVMIATHDLDQARAWDRVLCLNGRQIAYGPPAETLTRQVLEATYGGEIVMLGEEGALGRAPALLPPHHHEEEHDH